VIAGRLVSRYGRWLTTFGLASVGVGLAATAAVLVDEVIPSVRDRLRVGRC
jgi:hypothetical protein